MQAGHHARQKDDPGRLDAPAIEPFQALDDGFAQLFRGGGVAENAMLDPLLKSFKDARWSAKVAVGDPQRNDVAPGIALPAGAPGAGALERRVEIEFHRLLITKKSRARGPAPDCASSFILASSPPPLRSAAGFPSAGLPRAGSCCRRRPGFRPPAARNADARATSWRCQERT